MSKLMPPWTLPLGQTMPTQPPPGMDSAPANTTTKPAVEASAVTSAPATGDAAKSTSGAGGLTASTQQVSSTQNAPAARSPWDLGSILPLIGIVVLMYLLLFRGQRKEEKKRKALVAEMKKGDKVMTIGGLIGRVVSIDNDEVVIKIDESANVKATYKKSSIQQVLVPGEEKSK